RSLEDVVGDHRIAAAAVDLDPGDPQAIAPAGGVEPRDVAVAVERAGPIWKQRAAAGDGIQLSRRVPFPGESVQRPGSAGHDVAVEDGEVRVVEERESATLLAIAGAMSRERDPVGQDAVVIAGERPLSEDTWDLEQLALHRERPAGEPTSND